MNNIYVINNIRVINSMTCIDTCTRKHRPKVQVLRLISSYASII